MPYIGRGTSLRVAFQAHGISSCAVNSSGWKYLACSVAKHKAEERYSDCRRFLLEWMSFTHRYIPIELMEVLPQVCPHVGRLSPVD